MRFAVGDAGSFLDAVKGGLFGAAFDNGLGGGALGAAGLYDPMKGVFGTDSGPANFIKRGGALGATGVYDPMKGVVFTDSAPTNFIKRGGVAGLAGYNPMEGVVGGSSPFGNFGGGLGAIGGLFGKGGEAGVGGLGGLFGKGGKSGGFLGSFLG